MKTFFNTVSLVLAIVVQATLGESPYESTNTCQPCGIYSMEHIGRNRLQMFLKYSIMASYQSVSTALAKERNTYGVKDTDSFDLTECCGMSYEVQEDDFKFQSVHQLIADTMLNLNDASFVGDAAGSLKYTIQNLNTSLCILETLDTSAETTSNSDTCLIPSQISSCTSGLAGKGITCQMKMLFRYLINAGRILSYLKESGRV